MLLNQDTLRLAKPNVHEAIMGSGMRNDTIKGSLSRVTELTTLGVPAIILSEYTVVRRWLVTIAALSAAQHTCRDQS
jgi:hypothetical protein